MIVMDLRHATLDLQEKTGEPGIRIIDEVDDTHVASIIPDKDGKLNYCLDALKEVRESWK